MYHFISAKILLVLTIAISLPTVGFASSWILLDAESGKIIAQNEASRPAHPASITKLMTAYTVFDEIRSGQIDLKSPVKVTSLALSMPPSKMGLPVGTILNIDNALKMIMVKSANDIATALAQSTKGSLSSFVNAMNKNAARLGMNNSHFLNPHGLHTQDQVTTARDMAILARALQYEFPQYADYFNISAIKFGKIRMRNHNKLLFKYAGTNGMKTGYTCASGLNVVARAKRSGRELIAVVLGGYSSIQRNILAARLLNAGFADKFENLERPTLSDITNSANIYGVPENLTVMICKQNWTERNQTKKQRQAKRKLHLASLKALQDQYLNESIAIGPDVIVNIDDATGLNPYNYKLKNGGTPPKIVASPIWRPDRATPPDE